MMKEKITAVFISIVSFVYLSCGESFLKANPDFFRSSMAVTSEKVPGITVGDGFTVKRFSMGALIEVRNESRFNQEILPNHNWRGVVKAEYNFFNRTREAYRMTLVTGLSHESAHPTMGIVTDADNAYELIYDNTYRRMILNALNIGSRSASQFCGGTLYADFYCHYYFKSKNTPELPGGVLTHGHGLSAGLQWEHGIFRTWDLYVSLFERIIFDSRMKNEGNIFAGKGDLLTLRNEPYPVISQVNTVAVKAGLNRNIGNSGVKAGLFTTFLRGNPFGFIDSRDKRTVFSLGFELFHGR